MLARTLAGFLLFAWIIHTIHSGAILKWDLRRNNLIINSSGLSHYFRLDSEAFQRLQVSWKITVLVSTVVSRLDNQVWVIWADELSQWWMNVHGFDKEINYCRCFCCSWLKMLTRCYSSSLQYRGQSFITHSGRVRTGVSAKRQDGLFIHLFRGGTGKRSELTYQEFQGFYPEMTWWELRSL